MVGASVAGMTQYLIPIIGVILSVILLGESIQTYHVAGIAVIFTGVWLVSSGRRTAVAKAPEPETGEPAGNAGKKDI